MLHRGFDQCNDCENKRCRTVDWYRQGRFDSKRLYEYKEMLGTCSRRIPTTVFSRSMLEIAMYRNVQGVYDTLSVLDMTLVWYGKRWSIISNKPGRKGKRKYGKRNVNRKTKRH